MSNFEKFDYILKYPEKEKAIGVVAQNESPFKSAVIGITYPSPEYKIESNTPWSCVGFEYVLCGEGEVLINGRWETASSGSVFVLREGETHEYRASKSSPWQKIWINYSAKYIGEFLDAYGVKTGVYRTPEARSYFEKAIELADNPDSFINLCYILAECVHNITYTVSAGARNAQDGYHRRIRDALDLAIYKKVDLDNVAASLHMSKSNMIRVFKSHYGTTPYDYLLAQKIEAAKLLLRGTNMPVREIADKLCILDEHYFSSLFLKRVGLRPRDYRTGDTK